VEKNIEQELYFLHLRLTGTQQFNDWRTFDLCIEIVTSAEVAVKNLTLNG
jgi:HrpA-like RNA helicase